MVYLVSIAAILTAIVWLCLALPTPDDQARYADSLGKTTGVNWR